LIKVVIDDEIPPGVVKCHCGTPLTSAFVVNLENFYYYKCKHSKHNNNASKHMSNFKRQDPMSVPERQIKEIRMAVTLQLNRK
jgi:hypothetical protein